MAVTRGTPVFVLSNQVFENLGRINIFSTNTSQNLSSLRYEVVSSNLDINNGIITLSNQFGDPTFHSQGLQLSNTGLKVYSDQFASLQIIGTGAVAEATFDTTAVGGPFMAMGAGTASRGAYFFVGGDAININQSNQAVSIANGGTAQSDYKLLVNGNAAFTSSITLSNGDFSMSNVRTQKADLISTSINIFNGNILQSNTVLGTATFSNTNMTVVGNLSTSGINFTAGPIVGAQYGAISTLALNSALAPPAINTVLDINGTMRNRVQIIQTTSAINPNAGNNIYFNITSDITVTLPSVTSTLGGTLFYAHKNTGHTVTVSSIAGQLVNGAPASYTTTNGAKVVSMLQLGSNWSVVSLN